jgi:hypothetical protein
MELVTAEDLEGGIVLAVDIELPELAAHVKAQRCRLLLLRERPAGHDHGRCPEHRDEPFLEHCVSFRLGC